MSEVQTESITYTTVWEPQAGPQTWLLQCPVFETLFGGARGGGKSDGILGEWAAHADEYGDRAIGLCVRRERIQLTELIERSKVLYTPLKAKFSEIDKMWRFPNGARLRFAYLENDNDAQSYQGHSYTRVYVEEMGTFPNAEPIFKLMATLSRDPTVPSRFIATANPGGPGHLWIKQRYIDPDPQGMRIIYTEFENPFTKEKLIKDRVFIPSKVTDNKYTNTAAYLGNLYLSGNEELVKAWLMGDWNVALGAYFPEFTVTKHVIKNFDPPKHWTRFMAMDWGSSTPFSIGWYCVVPDDFDPNPSITPDKWVLFQEQANDPILPKGAIIKYREWYGSQYRQNVEKGLPNPESMSPNVGLKLTAVEVAAGIARRERDEPKDAQGNTKIAWRVADPKIFSSDNGPSIAEIMGAKPYRVGFTKADNKRVAKSGAVSGWDVLRARLKGVDGRPLIYFMENCIDTIRTLPALQHDDKNLEDAMTTGEDHAPDETRYACMSRPYSITHKSSNVRSVLAAKDNGVFLNDDLDSLPIARKSYESVRIH